MRDFFRSFNLISFTSVESILSSTEERISAIFFCSRNDEEGTNIEPKISNTKNVPFYSFFTQNGVDLLSVSC